jgi:hypothetical protein
MTRDFGESRMRETRTSGSMRGRERAVIGLGLSSRAFSLYSTGKFGAVLFSAAFTTFCLECLHFFRNFTNNELKPPGRR